MSYQKLPPAAAVEALRSFTIAHMLLPEVIEESGRDRGWVKSLWEPTFCPPRPAGRLAVGTEGWVVGVSLWPAVKRVRWLLKTPRTRSRAAWPRAQCLWNF